VVLWQGTKRAVLGCAGAFGLLATLGACDPGTPPPLLRGPDDVEVEVLNPDRPKPLRCNPEIRLDRKVSAEKLQSVTRRLLEKEDVDCKFGFAAFYLPAMQPGSGAWAIAELGPDVTISILGLSSADEEALLRRAEAHGKTFGLWVDDTSYASVVSLEQGGGGLELVRFYLDGGVNRDPIKVASAPHGYELRPSGGSRHYRFGADGELESWDGIGFLSAARKVRGLDADLAALKRDDDARRARRSSAASAGRSQRRAAAHEERWRKFSDWLAAYEGALGPARHPVLALGASHDAGDRAAVCAELVRLLESVPPEVRVAPSPAIDIGPLLASLEHLRESCAGSREIKVLLDAAAASAAWRTVDRSVEQVVSELRPVEE
jgi:hypothetical protein